MKSLVRRTLLLVSTLSLFSACNGNSGPVREDEGSPTAQSADAVRACATGATVQGIDVSGYQGSINWGAVASQKSFAIMKATEGTGFVDGTFASNWANSKRAGIIRGAYHFFHPSNDPIAEANHFVDTMGPLSAGDLPPMLDLEVNDGMSPAHVANATRLFLQHVESRTGRRPMIYTGYYFWTGQVGDPSGFSQYPLVMAAYVAGCPLVPNSWGKFTMWQYSDAGRVSGIAGGVDLDVFNGSLAELRALANGGGGGGGGGGGNVRGMPGANVAKNADGRLELFVRGTDGVVYHVWQDQPNGTWSSWGSLGGQIQGSVAVTQNQDGRLEAFALGTDNAIWHTWQLAPNGDWSGWDSLGGWVGGAPVVAKNADGRLEVFVRGMDDAVYHKWQDSPGGVWSDWANLDGKISSAIAAGTNADGRLELFARGQDGALWHVWQTQAGGAWSGWASLGGGIVGDPTVAKNQNGTLVAFVRGTNDEAYHNEQVTPGGAWSGWASLGGNVSDLAVTENKDGRLELFARTTSGGAAHLWQSAPSGAFTAFAPIDALITGVIAPSSDADGRLEVFAHGTDNAIYHMWQDQPGGAWSDWASLGGLVEDF